MTEDMWENLDFMVDKFSSETLAYLIGKTKPYKRQVEKAILAEECYERLELTEVQRNIIGELLDQREIVSQGYANLAYLAGIMDCTTAVRRYEWAEPGQAVGCILNGEQGKCSGRQSGGE